MNEFDVELVTQSDENPTETSKLLHFFYFAKSVFPKQFNKSAFLYFFIIIFQYWQWNLFEKMSNFDSLKQKLLKENKGKLFQERKERIIS